MAKSHRGGGRVGVVIATHNRVSPLLHTLSKLRALPEEPRIVVVDNASHDGTAAEVERLFSDVEVISLRENEGAAARTVGAAALDVPYLAFSDSDSWWAPGALARAAEYFDLHPRLGLVAARVLVGDEERLDPTCRAMAGSPLRDPGVPGRPVLGFIACGSVVRRSAFLSVGGFEPRFGVGGEEELLAVDLAAAGWSLAYMEDVVAHHHPSAQRDAELRQRTVVRNRLWTAWLRRPAGPALRETIRALRQSARDRHAAAGLADALRGWPWVLANRKQISPELEARLQALESVPGPGMSRTSFQSPHWRS
jgi:N-acetylglucosaminyl-diphospho-decaprenol L-rhamnosyltransferase